MTLTLTGTAGAPVGVIALGPQTRSLTLTGTAEAPVGFITLTDFPTVALYNDNNGWLASLPFADAIKYARTISDPGFVSMRLPLDDPATDLATPGTFLKVFWRGKCRQAAEITDSGVDMAVDGEMWRVFDNLPGVLNLLAKGCVWPEYGIDRTYSTDRTFGYMSVLGAWYNSGDWTNPEGIRYREDTGFRQFKPAGLSYPNPYWIARGGPYHIEPAGSTQWVRHHFTTYDDEMDIQILATGDDLRELWLDGERIITPDSATAEGWRSAFQYTAKLGDGLHVIAAKIRNSKRREGPMAFLLALQQLKKNGDVVLGEPVTVSSPYWWVSDVLPGFRRADVIRRCIFENRLHDVPVFDLIRLGFDEAKDTSGAGWADVPDQYTRPVGESMLTTVQWLAEKFLDIGMDPDSFNLQGWNRKGSDKSGTVIIRRGQADTIGSLVSGGVDRQAPKFTVLLIQLSDSTWVEFADDDLVDVWGRIIQSVSAGSTATASQAQHVADGLFREQALAAATVTATITALDGPQYHVDFDEGDTIGFEDENGDVIPVRVMSALVDASADGDPTVELELVRDDD